MTRKRPLIGAWDRTLSDAKLLHEGRRIVDDRNPGSCGIPEFVAHVRQLRDPDSWVHESVPRWRAVFEPTADEVAVDRGITMRDLVTRLVDVGTNWNLDTFNALVADAEMLVKTEGWGDGS